MRPPELALAITVSPARLLGGLLLLAVVVSMAALLAWRRMRAAAEAVDEPLQRLRGFHIFGPDDGDDDRPPLHTPVLLREASHPAAAADGESRLRVPVLKAVPMPGATAPTAQRSVEVPGRSTTSPGAGRAGGAGEGRTRLGPVRELPGTAASAPAQPALGSGRDMTAAAGRSPLGLPRELPRVATANGSAAPGPSRNLPPTTAAVPRPLDAGAAAPARPHPVAAASPALTAEELVARRLAAAPDPGKPVASLALNALREASARATAAAQSSGALAPAPAPTRALLPDPAPARSPRRDPAAPEPRPPTPVAPTPAAVANPRPAAPPASSPPTPPPAARAPRPARISRPKPAVTLVGRDDTRSAPVGPAPPDLRGRDILLVEDDTTIATMYLMLLGTKGYATRHAHDGVEGIAMVREERPALILLDMLMPRMDGLQFLEALRGWPKTSDIPVVILSNVADHDLVERALELGAVEYLVKAQTRPQVLVGALPHWLRGNRALTGSA